jgi:hypothetical protein
MLLKFCMEFLYWEVTRILPVFFLKLLCRRYHTGIVFPTLAYRPISLSITAVVSLLLSATFIYFFILNYSCLVHTRLGYVTLFVSLFDASDRLTVMIYKPKSDAAAQHNLQNVCETVYCPYCKLRVRPEHETLWKRCRYWRTLHARMKHGTR